MQGGCILWSGDEDARVSQAETVKWSKDAGPERRRGVPRWAMWAVGLVLVALVIAGAVAAYVVHNAEPILRRRVIATMEDRFRSPVELDELHISVLKGLQVSGGGLRILYFGENDAPGSRANDVAPMLSVKSFEFHTGMRELFQPVMRVSLVNVQGMELRIPPKAERASVLQRRREQVTPRRSIVVDKIQCSDVTLTIETDKPGKDPLVFDIRDVTLHDVGAGKPVPFDARLVNPKPVGDIHSSGHFGPWQDVPRDTPVDGEFSFTNADLGTIKGISGRLSSTGTYGGTLGEIDVTGTTDTPDFALDVSEHPVDLKTEYNATVDGTTGDTKLNSVHATLLHTVLQVSGMVVRANDAHEHPPGDTPDEVPGHFIDLSVVSSQARVEDVLRLGVKTSPPLMRGGLTLRTHLSIPPGKVSVSKKMRLQGTFAIRGATLSNAKWQDTLDNLSLRAQGNPKELRSEVAPVAPSQIGGSFTLANAVLDMPKLSYQMPGTQVDLAGKYSLDGETFDFAGTVRTKATASQMLTGWKSIAAMPFDRLLKKDGAGVEVPVMVNGTSSDLKFGVDKDKLWSEIFSRHDKQEGAAGEHP
jgi:hypothetical protein